ncbi:MAG TPA: hypothetical protein PK718_06090 [Candidatus Methanofastidiosa archaeon]|nr:hypothetical protein [Candidatus Methanofastidiosa archaeon]HPR42102.1 hypothetical protein [Candidatus Methanofastidiosa archaeon]
MNTKTIATAGIFGALALLMTMIKVPMHFGNPNLGSTPVSISAVMFTPGISFLTGLIKGVGASLWTGQPHIELAAGIGDAMMAVFTFHMMKFMKAERALVIGQLSRYVFTSSLIALSVSIFVNGNIMLFSKTWIAIFPAVTLSIIANATVSVILVRSLSGKAREWLGLKLGDDVVVQSN